MKSALAEVSRGQISKALDFQGRKITLEPKKATRSCRKALNRIRLELRFGIGLNFHVKFQKNLSPH